jgi:hypothetical protein
VSSEKTKPDFEEKQVMLDFDDEVRFLERVTVTTRARPRSCSPQPATSVSRIST